jgi:hypothetical protein
MPSLFSITLGLLGHCPDGGSINFTHTGSSFSPQIAVGPDARIRWYFPDGSTSESTTPSVDFGTAGTRISRLSVAPWSKLLAINVGYDGIDGGSGWDNSNGTLLQNPLPQQNVISVENLPLAQKLQEIACNYNPMGTLDLYGLPNLRRVDAYGSNLGSISVSGSPVLDRLNVEDAGISGELDLTGCSNLGDIRCSRQSITNIIWPSPSSLYHICCHSNPFIEGIFPSDLAAAFPYLKDFYFFWTDYTGHMDASNLFPAGRLGQFRGYGNNITSIDISNCSGLTSVQFNDNNFNQAAVDNIFVTMDSFGISSSSPYWTIEVGGIGNSPPSATGVSAISSLESRGWVCVYNAGTSYVVKQYAPAVSGRLAFDAVGPIASDGSTTVYRISTRDNPSQIGAPRITDIWTATCFAGTHYTIANNATERSGAWYNAVAGNFNSQPQTAVYCLGTASESVIYTVVVPENGSIVWEWVGNTVAGRAYFEIELTGIPIEDGYWNISESGGNRYLDTYQNATNNDETRYTRLASGLSYGTYLVTVTASGTEATDRLYDRGMWTVSSSIPGVPGEAPIVLEKQVSFQASNLEYAAFDGTNYYGGVHGDDGNPIDHVITVDSDVTTELLDTSTALGTVWSSSSPQWSWSSVLDTSDPYATLTCTYSIDVNGLTCTTTRTKDGYEGDRSISLEQEYFGMIAASNLENGGINRIKWSDGTIEVVGSTTPDTQVTYFPPNNTGSILFSDTQALYCIEIVSPGVIASDANSQDPYITQDRTDGAIKDYRNSISQISGNAIEVPDGIVTGGYRYHVDYRPNGGLLELIAGESYPIDVDGWTAFFDASRGLVMSGSNVTQWLASLGIARMTLPGGSGYPTRVEYDSRYWVQALAAGTQALVSNVLTHGSDFTVFMQIRPVATIDNYRCALETGYTSDWYLGGGVGGSDDWKAIIASASLDGPVGGEFGIGTEEVIILEKSGTTASLYSGSTLLQTDATVINSGVQTLPVYLNRTVGGGNVGSWQFRRWGMRDGTLSINERAELANLLGT